MMSVGAFKPDTQSFRSCAALALERFTRVLTGLFMIFVSLMARSFSRFFSVNDSEKSQGRATSYLSALPPASAAFIHDSIVRRSSGFTCEDVSVSTSAPSLSG